MRKLKAKMPNQVVMNWVLTNSINLLYENDGYLLNCRAHERTISAQLACYLRRLLPGFDVDAEYNRAVQISNEVIKKSKKMTKERAVIPDIIIHKRGSDDHNCMVLELKAGKSTNPNPDEKDKEKIHAIKKKFNYRYGVFLRLSETGIACLEWY